VPKEKEPNNEIPLKITDTQFDLLTVAERESQQAQSNLRLVYNGILAAHDVQIAEIVRMDDNGVGKVLVVRIPEGNN